MGCGHRVTTLALTQSHTSYPSISLSVSQDNLSEDGLAGWPCEKGKVEQQKGPKSKNTMSMKTSEREVLESKHCVFDCSWKANQSQSLSQHKDGCGEEGSLAVSPNRRYSSWNPFVDQRLQLTVLVLGCFLLDDVSV